MIKIPSSVSLPKATTWLSRRWTPENGHISGAMIYRSQVCSTDDGAESFLGHESVLSQNPHARHGLFSYVSRSPGLRCTVPVGRILAGEPRLRIRMGERVITDLEGYQLIRGRHVYQSTLGADGPSIKMEFSRIPGVELVWRTYGYAGGGGVDLSPNFPPTDELELV
jgi:hypothetical protein